jgi:cytosine/adenosine deaminase-related metal-dependent hydrolase
MKYIQGEILTKDGFINGYLECDNDHVSSDIRKGTPPKKPFVQGIILPSCVNAHTHIGDSFIRLKHLDLPHDVKELVGPPLGLKHRLLKEATEQEMLEGIQASLSEMIAAGTSWFCDFREEGLIGIYKLKKALKDYAINSMIFSRPSTLHYEKEEINQLLQNSEGIGLSSVSDWDPSEIEKIAQHVRQKKKLLALHASEVERENIDAVLDLHPSLLVHMIAATPADLERVKDAEIPIVVCPRSYLFFGLRSNLDIMKKTGVSLLLGTDNGMINTPDILEEIRLLQKTGFFSLEELLHTITYTPRKALNLDDCIQGRDLSEHIIVLEKDSLTLLYVSK